MEKHPTYQGKKIVTTDIVENVLTGIDNAQTAHPEILSASCAKVHIVWQGKITFFSERNMKM